MVALENSIFYICIALVVIFIAYFIKTNEDESRKFDIEAINKGYEQVREGWKKPIWKKVKLINSNQNN